MCYRRNGGYSAPAWLWNHEFPRIVSALSRPPVRLGRPASQNSPRQLRCGAAITACETGRIVERGDGDCSDESDHGQHKSHYDRARPVSACCVAPMMSVPIQGLNPRAPYPARNRVSLWPLINVSRSPNRAACSFGLASPWGITRLPCPRVNSG